MAVVIKKGHVINPYKSNLSAVIFSRLYSSATFMTDQVSLKNNPTNPVLIRETAKPIWLKYTSPIGSKNFFLCISTTVQQPA